MAIEGVNSIYTGQYKGGGVDSGNTQMIGRVIYTLLTDDPEQLAKMQVPSGSIGAIQFRMIYNGIEYGGNNFLVAYPLVHIKKYPVQNELVNIISRASSQASNAAGNTIPTYYYDDIIPLFDSPEHNALPSDKSFSGSNQASITGPFVEKGNIYKLQHLPGDSVIDARFGQSIRFGNSHPDFSSSPWKGPQGNPVLTITNGQKKQTASNISSVYEDINGDGSSIWALNNHKIQFVPASTNFLSYGPGTTSTVSKNNIIVANNQVASAATSSLDKTDKVPVKDTPPVVYPTQTKTVVSPTPEDEVAFLPDKEEPEYTQEQEQTSIPHQGGNQDDWINIITNVDISRTPDSNLDLSPSMDLLFVIYLMHNQGPGGAKAILYYAKQGSNSIPKPAKFNRKSWDGESLMFGKVKNPKDVNSGNVGNDFLKYYGTNFTPLNFLNYMNRKVIARYNQYANKVCKYESIFVAASNKYGVPLTYLKTVAGMESDFIPTTGQNHQYKGLFQIDMAQFQSINPGSTDIYDPEKNTMAGAAILKSNMNSAKSIIQVLN
jgi:hypothetical protein